MFLAFVVLVTYGLAAGSLFAVYQAGAFLAGRRLVRHAEQVLRDEILTRPAETPESTRSGWLTTRIR
jgi:hypothetical protein